MATVKMFRAKVPSRNNDTFRITMYDLAALNTPSQNTGLYGYAASESTDPLDIDVRLDSCEIVYDAPVDHLHTPIVGSRFDMSVVLDNDTFHLLAILRARNEGKIAVVVERHNGTTTDIDLDSNYDPYWIGCLTGEAVSYDFTNPPVQVDMSFSDGLSMLRDIPFQSGTDTFYHDTTAPEKNLRRQIGLALRELPHDSLLEDFADSSYFTELLDLYHWNHVDTTTNVPGSILDKTTTNMTVWAQTRLHENPFNRPHKVVSDVSTCYEVIQDIMIAVGGTFFHRNGGWCAVSSTRKHTGSGHDPSDRAWESTYNMLSVGTNQNDAATAAASADWPNEVMYDGDDVHYLQGSQITHLNGVHGVTYTHKKGGNQRIMSEPYPVTIHGDAFNIGEDYFMPGPDPTTPSYDSGFGGITGVNYIAGPTFPIQNFAFVTTGERNLRIKGRVVLPTGLSASDDDYVGAQPVLKFKIRMGDQYLKQTVGVVPDADIDDVDDFGRIRIAVGNPMNVAGVDITTWKPLVITSDPEWTTNSSDTFDIPFNIINQMEPSVDTIEHTDGSNITAYPVGLNTVRHENNAHEMRFRWADRNNDRDLILDIVTPDLPGDTGTSYTSVTIDCDMEVYKNDMTVESTFANTPYPHVRIHNFRVFDGELDADADAIYVSHNTSVNYGLEMINGGTSLLGSRHTDLYGNVGFIKADDTGHRADGAEEDGFSAYWFTESESGRAPADTTDGGHSYNALAHEHHVRRRQTRRVYDMQVLLDEPHMDIAKPTDKVRLNTHATDPDQTLTVMQSAFNLSQGLVNLVGFAYGRVASNITGTDSVTVQRERNRTGVDGVGPVGATKNFYSGISGVTSSDATKLTHISGDADGITGITVKAGSTPIQHDEVGYDVDTLVDANGDSKPELAIKNNAEDITLVAKSAITGQEGTYKFTVADFFAGIVQAGLTQAVDDGFATEADYQGATSGLLGDFDDDGAVTSADLLVFLSLFGDIYESDADLFSTSSIQLLCGSDQFVAVDSADKVTLTFASDDTLNASPGTNGINVNAGDNNIEFVSGSGLPITSWPTKKATIKLKTGDVPFYVKTTFPNQTLHFYRILKLYNALDVLVETREELMGTVTVEVPTGDNGTTVTAGAMDFTSTTTEISENTVTKIQVSVAVQAANESSREYEARIHGLEFRLF